MGKRFASAMLALSCLLALASTPALARDPLPPRGPAVAQRAPHPKRVQVHYLVVYASNERRGMDARLRPIADSLRVLKFTGFDVIGSGEHPLAVGQTRLFDLPGRRRLEVTLSHVDPQRARLKVRMLDGPRATATTNLTIRRNGTFLYGGVRYKSGRLVVPIRVRY